MLTAVGFWTLGRLTATKNIYRPSTRQSSWWAACCTTPLDRKLQNGLEWTIPMSKPLSLRMQLPLALCPWCWWCLQCLDCFGNPCDQLKPSCESVNAAKALLREMGRLCTLRACRLCYQRCTVDPGSGLAVGLFTASDASAAFPHRFKKKFLFDAVEWVWINVPRELSGMIVV